MKHNFHIFFFCSFCICTNPISMCCCGFLQNSPPLPPRNLEFCYKLFNMNLKLCFFLSVGSLIKLKTNNGSELKDLMFNRHAPLDLYFYLYLFEAREKGSSLSITNISEHSINLAFYFCNNQFVFFYLLLLCFYSGWL